MHRTKKISLLVDWYNIACGRTPVVPEVREGVVCVCACVYSFTYLWSVSPCVRVSAYTYSYIIPYVQNSRTHSNLILYPSCVCVFPCVPDISSAPYHPLTYISQTPALPSPVERKARELARARARPWYCHLTRRSPNVDQTHDYTLIWSPTINSSTTIRLTLRIEWITSGRTAFN